MIYSPLAVHCTSLCCDLLENDRFSALTHRQIDWLYDEVFELVAHRTEGLQNLLMQDQGFIQSLTDRILTLLHFCKDNSGHLNVDWLLTSIQSQIDYTILHQ